MTFSRTRCSRCGIDRITGVACPDCGAAPKKSEVDHNYQRRLEAVSELLVAATEPIDLLPEHTNLESGLQLPEATVPCLDRFATALKRAAESEFRDTADLEEAVDYYRSLRQAANQVAVRRPFARPTVMSIGIIEQLGLLISEYLQAYAARTPVVAQGHGDAAQALLDELAVRATDLSEWLARRTGVSAAQSMAEAIGLIIEDAKQLGGATTLMQLMTEAPDSLRTVFGSGLDDGTILRYAIQRSLVDLFLNSDSYNAKLRRAAELFAKPNTYLDELLSDPIFQSDFQRLELELLDEAVRCQDTLRSTPVIRQAARAVVALNTTLVEAAGKTVAAPIHIAAGTKTKPYAKLKNDNATELIKLVASSAGFPDLVAGLDPHLRTAHSHAAISYEEDALTTSLSQGTRTYVYDDLIEATFEAWESCMAVLLCVHQAMAVRGILHEGQGGLASLGLTSQEIVDTLLPSLGAQVASSEIRDGTLVLTTDAVVPTGFSVALAGLFVGLGEGELEEVELHLSDGTCWTIAASAFKREPIDLNDEFEAGLSALQVQRLWRNQNGEPRASDSLVRKWIATQVAPLLTASSTGALRRLRVLRDVAVELGDPVCATVLKRLSALVRVQAMGMQPTEDEMSSVSTLQGWLTDPCDLDFI